MDANYAALVERLVVARLLTSDGDTVELAHEALARAWPRLKDWLDEDVDGLRLLRHVTAAAERFGTRSVGRTPSCTAVCAWSKPSPGANGPARN